MYVPVREEEREREQERKRDDFCARFMPRIVCCRDIGLRSRAELSASLAKGIDRRFYRVSGYRDIRGNITPLSGRTRNLSGLFASAISWISEIPRVENTRARVVNDVTSRSVDVSERLRERHSMNWIPWRETNGLHIEVDRSELYFFFR